MSRVLFVAPWLPSRIRPRSLGILRHLATTHDVWVVGLDSPAEERADLARLDLAGCTLVPLRTPAAVARAATAVLGRDSLQAAYVREPSMRTALRTVVRRFQPDVAHLNVIRSAAYLPDLGGLPVVFDLDEVRSDYYRQTARTSARPLTRAVALLEAGRMARAEETALRRSDVALMSSPVDVRAGGPCVLVRSPHELGGSLPRPTRTHGARGGTLLFVGRMGYAPNVAGVRWFADRVLPELRRHRPDLRLVVAGENPPTSVRRLTGPGVDVLGRVADLAPLYAAADVAVVPIHVGTGVQMKLIQALACGVPTVATPVALHRAGLTAGIEAVAADDAEGWVAGIRRLLDRPASATAMAERGRDWATEHYSTESVGRAVDEAYRLLGDRSGRQEQVRRG